MFWLSLAQIKTQKIHNRKNSDDKIKILFRF